MIHSMSGGIIKDPGSYTFVKIAFDDDPEKTPYWYVSDFSVAEGGHARARHRPARREERQRSGNARAAAIGEKAFEPDFGMISLDKIR